MTRAMKLRRKLRDLGARIWGDQETDREGELQPLRPLPADRTLQQLRHHFEVERAIATRLLRADRQERRRIFATMYEELFEEVPDHPRLTRRHDEALTARANASKYALVRRFLRSDEVFLEFAPGDCSFACRVAGEVQRVLAVDISDQRSPTLSVPKNFELVVYDGYDLSSIPEGSVDLVFSDQLLEHFHPEDTLLHFQTVRRLLRPGGRYVFRTPHPFTGPHDVSGFFRHTPEGFHLKEWTHRELAALTKETGFSRYQALLARRTWVLPVPYPLFALEEAALRRLPPRVRCRVSRLVIPPVCGIAVK